MLQKPLFVSLTQATRLLHGERSKLGAKALRRLSRFLAALIAALCSFSLLNKSSPSTSSERTNELEDGTPSQTPSDNDSRKRKREYKIPPGLPPLPPAATLNGQTFYPQGIPLAGKTIDLTLFAVVRAADAVIQWHRKRHPARSRTARMADSIAAPLLFAASSATIMHAFFYKPGRLPHGYVRWIERIAGVDPRIIAALRHAYYGNFVYGKDTGMAPLLGSLCAELGIPEELGDPAKTIPVSCDLVHQRAGLGCEAHALRRFWIGWVQAMELYAPLQAVLLLRTARRGKDAWRRAALAAFREAARSSAFLGAFIALFYVGVCGARTRLGPLVFPRRVVSAQAYDSGLAIAVGCLLCGWSVLLEPARRRTELMLFVVPRAVAVWLPRRYSKQVRPPFPIPQCSASRRSHALVAAVSMARARRLRAQRRRRPHRRAGAPGHGARRLRPPVGTHRGPVISTSGAPLARGQPCAGLSCVGGDNRAGVENVGRRKIDRLSYAKITCAVTFGPVTFLLATVLCCPLAFAAHHTGNGVVNGAAFLPRH